MTDAPPPPESRCGFVALLGAPNAGKSTLLNRLVGTKVSIVTHKVQTTRTLVRGIALHGAAQVVFVDTPGIFRPRRRLDTAMVRSAWAGAGDADLVVLIVDAARGGRDEDTDAIVEKLADVPHPRFLVINKVDAVRRDTLLERTAALNAALGFEQTFMVSALTGDGVGDLMDAIAARMPPGPWLYPEDQLSDFPLRQLAAEITREKVYLRLHQELPYESTVETEGWTEQKNGIRVEQTIYVTRESQRAIVLGKGGRTIRDIGKAAREELSQILERPVHLFLFVKVRENWSDDPERYREMGLEFPRE